MRNYIAGKTQKRNTLSKDESEITKEGHKVVWYSGGIVFRRKNTPISTLWFVNRRSIKTANEIANVPKITDKIEDVTGVRPNFLTDFRDKLLHIFTKYTSLQNAFERAIGLSRSWLNRETFSIFVQLTYFYIWFLKKINKRIGVRYY